MRSTAPRVDDRCRGVERRHQRRHPRQRAHAAGLRVRLALENDDRRAFPRGETPSRRASNGVLAGEGASVVVLERESDAKARGVRPLARVTALVAAFDATAPVVDWGSGAAHLARANGRTPRAFASSPPPPSQHEQHDAGDREPEREVPLLVGQAADGNE